MSREIQSKIDLGCFYLFCFVQGLGTSLGIISCLSVDMIWLSSVQALRCPTEMGIMEGGMTTVASKGETISHIHEKRNSVEYFLAWCEVLTDICIENQKSPKSNNK